MNYADIRHLVRDGDVLLVKRRGFVSGAIRALTGESYNHVAMLVWLDGLWVAEYREFVGFQLLPASQWLEQADGTVWWGTAPVRGHKRLKGTVLAYRDDSPPYGYWTLAKVWWSQIRNKPGEGGDVCSTWIQRMWEAVGFEGFRRLADPGDVAEVCHSLTPVQS